MNYTTEKNLQNQKDKNTLKKTRCKVAVQKILISIGWNNSTYRGQKKNVTQLFGVYSYNSFYN